MKKYGFTLTEVLVTLGIIGVVSAMTIPSLTQSWQKRTYATQMHKVYNQLSQAFERALTERRVSNLSEAHIDPKEFFHNNFKVVSDCGDPWSGSFSSGCFANEYKTISGNTKGISPGYNVSIADGSSIGIYTTGSPIGGWASKIAVDVNGPKGPNIWGRDLFVMKVYDDGVIDAYFEITDEDKDGVDLTCRQTAGCAQTKRATLAGDKYVNCKSSGDSCFAALLNDNWEMKY